LPTERRARQQRILLTLARISHTHYDGCTIASRSIALSNERGG
jgi:hypothetical protein